MKRFLSHLLAKLTGHSSRRTTATPRLSCRPEIESLEMRDVPTSSSLTAGIQQDLSRFATDFVRAEQSSIYYAFFRMYSSHCNTICNEANKVAADLQTPSSWNSIIVNDVAKLSADVRTDSWWISGNSSLSSDLNALSSAVQVFNSTGGLYGGGLGGLIGSEGQYWYAGE